MGVLINMDADSLETDRRIVAEELGQIRTELAQLQNDMTKMNQSWEGPAAVAAQARMAEDIEGALSVCAYLEEYLACMERAQKAYRGCEKKMEEVMAQVRI